MTKEIVLIVAGIIIVIVSFLISEHKAVEKQRKLDAENLKNLLKDDLKLEIIESIKTEQKNIEKESENVLKNKKIDILNEIEDEMSKLSNEKIMSFSEYGEQILEKIEQNHQEVVFLYDMLNQKENEIKELIGKIDNSKLNLEEMLISVKEQEKEWEIWKNEKEAIMEELARKEIAIQKVITAGKRLAENTEKEENEKKKVEEKQQMLTAKDILSAKKEEKESDCFSTMQNSDMKEFREIKIENKMEQCPKKSENSLDVADRGPAHHIDGPFSFGEVSMGNQEKNSDHIEDEERNSNEAVLDLYAQGMSVVEIAKILGRGQGEIKLIIDLYQGRKM